MPDSIYYPHKVYRFRVTLDGAELFCSEVSGIDASFEEVEYRNGADKNIVKHKQHGLITYSNITLKKGMTDSVAWFNFVYNQIDGETERKILNIDLIDDDGEINPNAGWQVEKAWVLKYTGPDLNATSSEVAFETIEICNEGVRRLGNAALDIDPGAE